MNSMNRAADVGLAVLIILALRFGPTARAALAEVSIIDFAFSPARSDIKVNDSVRWTWVGSAPHSSTSSSNPPLWDSGVHGHGFIFANTFPSAGQFPYFCTVHPFMKGSINVQAPVNAPPTVTIISPSNGATFAAPWNGTIQANASDSDGTVTNVEFFANGKALGSATTAPFHFTVTNLGAGAYTLTATVADNGGATGASPAVTISVVAPAPVRLSNPRRLSATEFQFDYNANAGLTYAVERSTALPQFTAITTNVAAGNQITFTDNSARLQQSFYRVRLLSNP